MGVEGRHVNKKALDQFQSFTDQRADLVRRLKENDRSEEKIKELIGTLDLRKDEAIERTFRVRLHAGSICPQQLACVHWLGSASAYCTEKDP